MSDKKKTEIPKCAKAAGEMLYREAASKGGASLYSINRPFSSIYRFASTSSAAQSISAASPRLSVSSAKLHP